MNLAFLLHIYQPPIQESKKVEEITETSYLPLFKTIKNKPNFNLTVNIPLSLTYQLHATSSDKVVGMIGEMFDSGKIELTSTGAYHPLLTKIPDYLIEKEIVLNERGLAYYYGKDKGFEGEDALVIQNVTGFFPPEGAINQHVVEFLDQMGYSWVFADDVAVPHDHSYRSYNPVYQMDDMNIKVAVRNKGISDMLCFKRYGDSKDLLAQILYMRQEGKDLILALDGEFFGHHYKEGILFLNTFVDELCEMGINLVTVEELIEKNDAVPLKEVIESSWGASKDQIDAGISYPLWDISSNELHRLLWEVQQKVVSVAEKGSSIEIKNYDEMFDTFPLWDLEKLSEIKDVDIKNEIYESILLMQSVHSDQFWWASDADVEGRTLHKPTFVKKALNLYNKYATVAQNEELQKFIAQKSQEIESIL